MHRVLAVTVMLAASGAHADERRAMTDDFAGEKRGGFVLVGMGAVPAGGGARGRRGRHF